MGLNRKNIGLISFLTLCGCSNGAQFTQKVNTESESLSSTQQQSASPAEPDAFPVESVTIYGGGNGETSTNYFLRITDKMQFLLKTDRELHQVKYAKSNNGGQSWNAEVTSDANGYKAWLSPLVTDLSQMSGTYRFRACDRTGTCGKYHVITVTVDYAAKYYPQIISDGGASEKAFQVGSNANIEIQTTRNMAHCYADYIAPANFDPHATSKIMRFYGTFRSKPLDIYAAYNISSQSERRVCIISFNNFQANQQGRYMINVCDSSKRFCSLGNDFNIFAGQVPPMIAN